jgi:NADPH2:quinone reductase
VSGKEKAQLATAAGAHHVVNYRDQDATAEIRRLAPDGVHIVVEVAPSTNAALNSAVTAPDAVVAFYADDHPTLTLAVRPSMFANLRYQGVFVYTVPPSAKDHAVSAVTSAVAASALRVGDDAGLPLHLFPLARTAEAHLAVEQRAVGKVLVTVPD